jgi:molecular chaperone GrpE
MTTPRRIPINGQPAAPSAGRRPGGPGRPAGPDPVSAPAAPGTTAAPGSTTPPEAPTAAAPSQERPAEQAQLQAEVEALRHERDVLADSELRLRAEFENFRKRASREATELRERAQGQLLVELLPVLENLERALDAAEHHDEGKVLGGVRMTRDMFVELLRRAGVEEIETVGALFDPHVHDAVLAQPSEQEEGTVTAVLERGYRQGDRVLRPARVAVSSGPAGPAGGSE